MEIKQNLTTQNFNAGTISRIKYIVVHYTGNNGDTALGNTNYFKQYRGASAHYFVDENEIYQSIEDKNVAWHCGANSYYHNECRNHNSLGVEMCSYINNKGNYAFKPKVVTNTVELVKHLMEKYKVPIENVVRHYDVTHMLLCPYCGSTLRRKQVHNKRIEWWCSKSVEKGVSVCKGIHIKDEDVSKRNITEQTVVEEVIINGKKCYSYTSKEEYENRSKEKECKEVKGGSILQSVKQQRRTAIKL